VLITADQNVIYRQNRKGSQLALVVVSSNRETPLRRNAQSILDAGLEVPRGGAALVRLE